jgi:hypothetical protein
MTDLKKISQEIREIISERQKEFQLTFEEETHTYTMLNSKGELRSDFPSVSKVMKLFYDEFPTEQAAFSKAGGDPDEAERLINEWAELGRKSTNLGSRCHYLLEEHTLKEFGIEKEVRQPIFDCDAEQIIKSDSMIMAGKHYIELLKERGCELIDTEMVLGHPELEYTGQPDKVWLVVGTNGNLGILITDWKSNKPKNFVVTRYTKQMKKPFQDLPDNALGHYNTQLPFYGKLLLKMLEGTKYENIQLLGCIVVLITDEREYHEYRVSKKTINTILEMDMKQYLTKLKK